MSQDTARATRVTVPHVRAQKGQTPLVMVTAYDVTFARLFDEAGVDLILVGDSLGMVVQGNDSTLPVTTDEIVYHCRAVARGCQRAHVVGDMPFMSYQASAEDAMRNAGRLLAEGGAHSVKLEGGLAVADTVGKLVRAGIPVMGHIGLTPQSVHAMGGFRVQGRSLDAQAQLREDAQALEDAGAYAIVLEGIPGPLAAELTASLSIPTIGIGAGVHCDGQVLVGYDLLGLLPGAGPKFVKRYEDFFGRGVDATRAFAQEVRSRAFPTEAETYGMQVVPGLKVVGGGYGPKG